MNQISDWFVPALLRASLYLTVAALLVATCVKYLRIRSRVYEQTAWLLVLIQGVMFVGLTIPVPSTWIVGGQTTYPPTKVNEPFSATQSIPLIHKIPQPIHDIISHPPQDAVRAEMAVRSAGAVANSPTTLREQLSSWRMLVSIVWLIGFLTIIVAGLIRYGTFVRLLRAAVPAPTEWIDEWNDVCKAACQPLSISLVVADNIGPALCRLPIGYQLVLPEQLWKTLSVADRRAIYRHELEHYLRNDLWWILGTRLLATVHWFNPCAWWAASRFEAQSEFACDTAAAAEDPIQFSELLVQLAAGRTRRIHGIQSVAAGGISERVQRLLNTKNATAPSLAIVPVVIAILAICIAGVRLKAIADDKAADKPTASNKAETKNAEQPARVVVPPSDIAADEIAGVVVDGNGKPVADVLVDVWHWDPGDETRTNEQGQFRLAGIEPKRRAEVLITKEGYTPAYFPQRPVGAKGWVVVLSDKTYIEGVVTGANGQPTAGAVILATFGPVQGDGVLITEVPTMGKTGPDGKYRLYLKPDTYDIQITSPNQGVKRLSKVVVSENEAKALSVTLEHGVRFEAHVVDSETGKPVEGFILWQWRPPKLFGCSDAEGRIVFEDLVPGEIEFNCGGREPNDKRVKQYYEHGPFGRWWSEDASREWDHKSIDDTKSGWQRNFDGLAFDLKLEMPPVEIVVERGVAISGRVTDPDGNPVVGATVAPARTGSGNSLTGDTRYSVKTKKDGYYPVVLPASNLVEYNLMVHDGEYQQWRNWANGVREPMKTTPGQVIKNYDLALTRPAIVRGKAMFAGKPAANREVRTHAFDKLENRYYDPTTTTDNDGNFELKFVRAGKQYLQVEPFWLSAEQAPGGSKIVEVEPGQVLEGQELVATPPNDTPAPTLPSLKFQARVINVTGAPVEGVTAGIGQLGGSPTYLTSFQMHYAKFNPGFTPSPIPKTNAEGLIDLDSTTLQQINQSTAWVYAVDQERKHAGIALLDLNNYATADPAAGPQIIDVAIKPIVETVIQLDFAAISPESLREYHGVIVMELTRDNLSFQRLLASGEKISLLLPEGEYQLLTHNPYTQSVQLTFKVEADKASQIDVEVKPSRLGSLIGQPAPDFSQLKPGKITNPTLASLKGKLVIVDFWGHWCGPCVSSMPNLMQIYDEFKDRDVEMIAVHDDSVKSYDQLQTILKQLQKSQWNGREIPFPVVLDGGGEISVEGTGITVNGATTAAYGITSWPTTLVIDRDGRVRGSMSAHDLEAARKHLNELLAIPAGAP